MIKYRLGWITNKYYIMLISENTQTTKSSVKIHILLVILFLFYLKTWKIK